MPIQRDLRRLHPTCRVGILLSDDGLSSNGRTSDSGSESWGSNPCSPATRKPRMIASKKDHRGDLRRSFLALYPHVDPSQCRRRRQRRAGAVDRVAFWISVNQHTLLRNGEDLSEQSSPPPGAWSAERGKISIVVPIGAAYWYGSVAKCNFRSNGAAAATATTGRVAAAGRGGLGTGPCDPRLRRGPPPPPVPGALAHQRALQQGHVEPAGGRAVLQRERRRGPGRLAHREGRRHHPDRRRVPRESPTTQRPATSTLFDARGAPENGRGSRRRSRSPYVRHATARARSDRGCPPGRRRGDHVVEVAARARSSSDRVYSPTTRLVSRTPMVAAVSSRITSRSRAVLAEEVQQLMTWRRPRSRPRSGRRRWCRPGRDPGGVDPPARPAARVR